MSWKKQQDGQIKKERTAEKKNSTDKKRGSFREGFLRGFSEKRAKIWAKKPKRLKLHKTFRRSYRKDYERELKVPGLMHHAFDTFRMLGKHWKTFGLLMLLAVIFNIILVGLMKEETYTTFQDALENTSAEAGVGQIGNFAKAGLLLVSTITTGGLTQGMSEVQQVFAVIIFLVVWLVTVYLLRHYLVGNKVKLRDGLYNACTPLLSTFVVLVVIFIELLPIFLVIITYAAAAATDFLATPFYALVYFIFASLMILLSGYLISSSFMALVVVTAPGIYPLQALTTSADLMLGRRIKFIIRLIYLLIMLTIIWVIIMVPIILIDMGLKSWLEWMEGVPIVPFFLLLMTCFSFIYIAAYIYLFYRRMLEDQN